MIFFIKYATYLIYRTKPHIIDWGAQLYDLGERLNGIQEVSGSIPLISTKKIRQPKGCLFSLVIPSRAHPMQMLYTLDIMSITSRGCREAASETI